MNKVAVVTGGTSGIGFATVEKFINEGWIVYGLSRHDESFDIIEGGAAKGAKHLVCDVTEEESVAAAMRTIYDNEGRIDALICNAGFGISGAVEFTEVEDAKRLFDVNFFGGLRCAQAVMPYMRDCGCGNIVFTSSVAAVMPIPFQGFYSATKAAVNLMTGALRNEVREFGVEVCCVMPGDVKTGFTSAREKSVAGAEVYGQKIEKSVAVMENDERNGMLPSQIAAVIYKAATKRKTKPLYTPGIMYTGAVLLGKVLPARFVYSILGKLYIKKA